MTIQLDDDERRLARRLELKKQIAERNVQKKQLAALKAHLGKINARTDDAEREYQTSVAPLQSELAELDAAQVSAIMDGEPDDPNDDARRLEIVAEIGRHNEMLEATTKSNGSLAVSIERQIGGLGSSISKGVSLENKLVSMADPESHARQTVLRSRIHWADLRVKAAADAMQNCEANWKSARRNQPRAVRGYETLLEAARRELNDSELSEAETQAEQNELRKRMLAE